MGMKMVVSRSMWLSILVYRNTGIPPVANNIANDQTYDKIIAWTGRYDNNQYDSILTY